MLKITAHVLNVDKEYILCAHVSLLPVLTVCMFEVLLTDTWKCGCYLCIIRNN